VFIDCPHCLTRVVVGSDGICPSCGKSALGVPPASSRVLVIKPGMRLPSICATCGSPTRDRESVGASLGDRDAMYPLLSLFLVVLHPSRIFDLIAGAIEGTPELRYSVPRCASCNRRDGPLSARHVDVGERRVSIEVCSEFYRVVHTAPST
jgi:hypothetical protein